MDIYECRCPKIRTDGLLPCGNAKGYKRPDGFYCDCGHDVECCKQYGKIMKETGHYDR